MRKLNSYGIIGHKEYGEPKKLVENAGLSFQGSIVLGTGFVLTPKEREALILKDPRNGDCIQPYIGGREINTSPLQAYHRYIINFKDMPLTEAEKYPDLLTIIRDKVKPERDRLVPKNPVNRDFKARWWQFAMPRPNLYAAIHGLPRCLVISCVTKHLAFAFQSTDRIFNNKVYVFPFTTFTPFGTLQSRIHEVWARRLSATLKMDLQYANTDCFENFPFPHPDPRTDIPELADIGELLYNTRVAYMLTHNKGLTKTYNDIKDPNNNDPDVIRLRELHDKLDAAVARAYGWSWPISDDEIFERLLRLNEERYNG